MYPINKREIPATPKIYDILEVLAARHLYFLKCSLLARKIDNCSLLAICIF